MGKLILLLALLLSTSAQAYQKFILCTVDAQIGRTVCDLYIVTSPNSPSFQQNFTYAQITKSGTTLPLHIVKWSIIPWNGNQPGSTGQHVMLLESPAGSGWWKMPLWQWDGDRQKTESFSPALIFSPGDELCLVDISGNSNNAYSASYIVRYIIGP